ncbi:hypothetical protein NHX12_026049 [Muraenolepis orangiensis]|uniref:Uncharacterized protein n=1 Tax=Muraenolepis orangiensis TaxID=630683 RepID=A0A9Q0EJ45_9TELE|nr:hypothetical protein NHX12_026049 [Muraenolepis orangiensis]
MEEAQGPSHPADGECLFCGITAKDTDMILSSGLEPVWVRPPLGREAPGRLDPKAPELIRQCPDVVLTLQRRRYDATNEALGCPGDPYDHISQYSRQGKPFGAK